MPLFAAFIGSLSSALVSLFSRFLSFKVALRFASYTTWLTVLAAFLAAVYVCLTSLYGLVSAFTTGGVASVATSMVSMFFMGVGIFIPSNAGAVMSCVGSVWIATSVYRVQKHGIENYSK